MNTGETCNTELRRGTSHNVSISSVTTENEAAVRIDVRGLGDGPAIKSTGCSSRGPWFKVSMLMATHNRLYLQWQGIPHPHLASTGMACIWYTFTHAGIKHFKKREQTLKTLRLL